MLPTVPSEHSIASDIWTDIRGAFGQEQSKTSRTRRNSTPELASPLASSTKWTEVQHTDRDVDFVGPHPLRAAADLAAIPAGVILRRVRDLKCTRGKKKKKRGQMPGNVWQLQPEISQRSSTHH